MIEQAMDRNPESQSEAEALDLVFFALSDSIRRQILERVKEQPLTVSEIAAPFDISIQAISRHIQVLARAGLVKQERTGRISRCYLEAGPIYNAGVWLNQYSEYWQTQFDTLKGWLEEIEHRERKQPARKRKQRRKK